MGITVVGSIVYYGVNMQFSIFFSDDTLNHFKVQKNTAETTSQEYHKSTAWIVTYVPL